MQRRLATAALELIKQLPGGDCAEGILADDFDLRPVNQAVEP